MYNSSNLANAAISVENITLGNSNITTKQHENTTGNSLIRAPTGMHMLANTINYPLITNPFTTMAMMVSIKKTENVTPTNISEGKYTNNCKFKETLRNIS